VCHYPEPFAIPDLDKPEIERPKARPQGQEAEGITCASCHLTPDGKIRGPYGAQAPNKTVKEPNLKTSAMCVTAWQFCGDRVAEHEDVKNRSKPRKMGAQCNLLRVMTGTEKCKPVAKFITKQTALLIDYLQSVGDFGHHLESHPVTLGFVASACLCAVEFCECLARELINDGD